MVEYVKKEDVVRIVLESATSKEIFDKVNKLQPDDVIGVSTIERHMASLREERDKLQIHSGEWERRDNVIDSVEWALRIWKSEGEDA